MTEHSVRDPDFAGRVRSSFARQAFMQFIGAEITRLEAGHCEITLPYRRELSQQHGFFMAASSERWPIPPVATLPIP